MKTNQNNVATAAQDFSNAVINETVLTVSRKGNSAQKRQGVPAMWRILGRAKKTFDAQIVKDNKMK